MNNKQIQFLKSYANNCQLFFNLGKDGLTKNFSIMIDNALSANEMVKIKLLKTVTENKKVISNQLAIATQSQVVQIVGRVITLYRKSDKPKIVIPNL
jgi:RNA-binding protein